MANDIRQKIVLDGEKEYNAALKAAQRNLKVLRSELKAETAELGKNATEQQKAETRTKNLQKQIKEQEKMVRAYENALAEVKEKYGDNEEAVARWQVKLNDARTALANMRNSLDDVGKGMDKANNAIAGSAVEAKAFADSLEKISEVGKTVSSSIENAFLGIAGSIQEVVGDIWGNLMEISARANEWTDIAVMWGTTPATIQKWYHAIQSEGKKFADVSNMVTKVVTGDQKKITDATRVSAEGYENQWEYAMAVMDSLSKMDTEERMNALAGMGISNARQEGWLDLLNAWGDIQNNTAEFDVVNGGKGITEENLQKANELAISVAKIQESWQALTDNWYLELFGDVALQITGNVQNIIDAFHEYFSAEDQAGRDAAIKKIKDNIIDIFHAVQEAVEAGIAALNQVADELLNSNDEGARTIGSILKKITGWVEWLGDPEHWELIKKGIELVFGMWLAAKVMAFANAFASIAANLATISAFKGLGFMGGAGGAAGAGAGSLMLPVALAAITCGPLLYELIHGHDDSKANETTQQLEELNAAIEGREANEEKTVDVVGDVINGRRSFSDLFREPFEMTIQNLGTGNGADAMKKGVKTLLTGEDAFRDPEDKKEYYQLNDQWGIYNNDLNALLLAADNLNMGRGIREGADNKWKYNESVFKMLDKMQEVFGEDAMKAMVRDMPFITSVIQDTYHVLDNHGAWNELYKERGAEFVEQMNKPKMGKRLQITGDPVGIPASTWWQPGFIPSEGGNANVELSGAALRDLKRAVTDGISGMKFVMDREVVGRMLASVISETIARDAQ